MIFILADGVWGAVWRLLIVPGDRPGVQQRVNPRHQGQLQDILGGLWCALPAAPGEGHQINRRTHASESEIPTVPLDRPHAPG